MSYTFDVGDETVWSPALYPGEVYVRFLRQLADTVELPTGLREIASDMYDIDIDSYEVLIRKIAEVYFNASHPVLSGLLAGVLAPSLVVLERAGRPLQPLSDREREFFARAAELSMAR